MIYFNSFIFCGLVCLLGQIILDNTKLTPGHITAIFVVVVALPGDTVEIKGGWLYVNGIVEEADYDKIADPGIAEEPITLNVDEYFVLGDNRNNSEDSRSGNIGPVSKSIIAGRAWFKFTAEDSYWGMIK